MNILFISKEAIAADLVRHLQKEGHSVKLYIKDYLAKECFNGLVEKIDSWKKELSWVGKDGLIIFDDVHFGKTQDMLRKSGFNVVGGSYKGELLELDREYGARIFQESGLKTVPNYNFPHITEAIDFIKKNPAAWTIKHNNQSMKNFTYVGENEDGSDSIGVLTAYSNYNHFKNLTLQKSIKGVEMGIGRYFNGRDWVGPIEVNVEHTRLFPGNIGPITSEMGTVAWYEESNKFFDEVLLPLTDFLRESDFRGDFSINCIINNEGIFPLEATTRFGTPIIHLQTELQYGYWFDFLFAVATGKEYDMNYKKGFGVVTVVAAPPFPYTFLRRSYSSYKKTFWLPHDEEKVKHIYFEEVAYDSVNNNYYVGDSRGCVLHVAHVEETIEKAREKNNLLIGDILLPKKFYRNDIGLEFENKHFDLIKKIGYVNGPF